MKSALMAGAAIATVAGVPAAQAQNNVEKVVVTGSRIPQKGLNSLSPVTTITNVEAKLQGTSSAEQLLNNLPQVFADQGAEVTNGSSGTAIVNLRGLGSTRTLVLINGRRLHPASIVNRGTPAADLNTIPVALIERVEVLTGGASAVYGADAVAGVVNFIMRKNFEGVEVGMQWSIADHDNEDATMRALVAGRAATNPAEYRVPDKHVSDGRVVDIWGMMGVNSADGKGNVTLYATHRNADPIVQADRDFSACGLATNFDGTFRCVGSNGTPAAGRFDSVTSNAPGTSGKFTASGQVVAYNGNLDAFNFNPPSFLQRPDNRYLLGAQGYYELAPATEVYAEFSFSDTDTTAQIAPSGIFLGNGPVDGGHLVNCNNPLISVGPAPTVFDSICTAAGLTATDTATIQIGRRFVEQGPRRDIIRHFSYRAVTGLRGDIDTWSYDLTAQYGTTGLSEAFENDVIESRVNKALLVVDPDGAGPLAPACQSALDSSDPDCVPLNIFRTGQLTDEALDYVTSTASQSGTTQQIVVTAALAGEVGVVSPWAETPVAVALGGEYRFEKATLQPDLLFKSGDLFGQGGPVPEINGHYDVWEAFGEAKAMLVENAPFARSVELEGGYRISDYDTAGITHTYKYGVTWTPVDDVKVRGSFQSAIRAPNVVELFTPAGLGLWGGTDPCAGAAPVFTLAQCLNTGIAAAQYGTIIQCPAGQCSNFEGGNAALKPEESETTSFGLVFTPSFLKGFTATVDYFDIFIDGYISTTPETVTLSDCAIGGIASACAKIHRLPSGILFGDGFVEAINENTGSLSTRGIDFEARYKLNLDDVDVGGGSLLFDFVGTKVLEWTNQPIAGQNFFDYDCTGLFGVECGTPTFEWRHSLRTTWRTPWDLDLSVAWRHMSSVSLDVNTSNPTFDATCGGPCGDLSDAVIPAYDYIDIAFIWAASENIAIRGGINNLLDKDPPIVDSNSLGVSSPPFGNANTYPVVYDALGREMFVAVTTRF